MSNNIKSVMLEFCLSVVSSAQVMDLSCLKLSIGTEFVAICNLTTRCQTSQKKVRKTDFLKRRIKTYHLFCLTSSRKAVIFSLQQYDTVEQKQNKSTL